MVVLLLFYSYCYSETISEKSQNASAQGLNWVMTNVLPQYTGLTINAVSYKYTAIKAISDPFVVSVQNYNTTNNGFIFRSTDDWTARPGNTITKTIPISNVLGSYWGRGEITSQGIGSILDPVVTYSYKYDTCLLSVVTDTSCSTYKPVLPEIKLPEQVSDNFTQVNVFDYINTNEETQERNRKFVLIETKEKKLSDSKTINSLITAQAALQASALEALNNIPEFKLYNVAMPGGVYSETLKYKDRVLPDSKNSQRLNLSQQRLHTLMVESQYNFRK